jgi:hypothetical protein
MRCARLILRVHKTGGQADHVVGAANQFIFDLFEWRARMPRLAMFSSHGVPYLDK